VASRPRTQRVGTVFGEIERRGGTRALGSDTYHFLRTASWTQITLLFLAIFLVTNFAFAAMYYFGGETIEHSRGLLDDFWFSVQTMATIGYGYLTPHGTYANAVVTVECFFGIGLTALITGVFFARFSTPSARVTFSRVAIIGDHDGKKSLIFRMANERTTAIVEATVRVYLLRDERLATGEMMRRVYDLVLRRSTSPVFALSFLVVHVIDEASPLYGCTEAGLAASAASVIVTFTGTDDRLAATVHSRYVYTNDKLVFDRRFVDLFSIDPTSGRRVLDLGPIHDTIEVPGTVTTSPADPAAAG
jgi:inward rectifier potassium channel